MIRSCCLSFDLFDGMEHSSIKWFVKTVLGLSGQKCQTYILIGEGNFFFSRRVISISHFFHFHFRITPAEFRRGSDSEWGLRGHDPHRNNV